MSLSNVYRDLKWDLRDLEDNIKLRLDKDLDESILNQLLSNGDKLINQLKNEANSSQIPDRNVMIADWDILNRRWMQSKSSFRNHPNLIRNLRPFSASSNEVNTSPSNYLKCIEILEKTSESLHEATASAKEAEEVGAGTLRILGEQKDSLIRTKEIVTSTVNTARKGHQISRIINRRVITNKLLLVIIIVLELIILCGVIYWKFFR